VHACTDVTGFGLVGHLLEMVRASAAGAEIYAERVPLLTEALEWATAGIVPGGTKQNLAWTSPFVEWAADIPKVERLLLCDAQTSGGLLLALGAEEAESYVARLRQVGVAPALIGHITEEKGVLVAVRGIP